MTIAIISDVHGNLEALTRVFEYLKEQKIDEIKKEGVDIKDIEQLLTSAKSAFANDDFDIALETSESIMSISKALTERYGQAQAAIRMSLTKIAEAKNIGANVSHAEEMFAKAKEF